MFVQSASKKIDNRSIFDKTKRKLDGVRWSHHILKTSLLDLSDNYTVFHKKGIPFCFFS